jgi:hypothetical protein
MNERPAPPLQATAL